ncbi:hypothetical protein ACFL27_14125 [candidate division CSSED10-310 bacterium]|uniref:Uncharacterized protein n=1 Tax=candidate division CSSED10-310 bacterium TaxID=2855610 RepID=A0ABV6YYQ4_UNCC1
MNNDFRVFLVAQATITEEHLRLAEIVRPKLVQDGMFLVGNYLSGFIILPARFL